MRKITVDASRKYDILIGRNLLREAGKLTSEVKKPCRAVIVTDDIVYGLYGKAVAASYEEAGFRTCFFVLPHGESSKNMQNLMRLLEFLADERLTRSDIVVALGGGVVGDFAGFAAAIYLRGIEYVQIPTTFLAAVDSSVGGKTAVDLIAGKNLAGAFHQPNLVVCDVNAFDTLSDEIFADGIAEAVKYGAIVDADLFDKLLHNDLKENIIDVVERCVSIKRDIVQSDEFDTGIRQLLNFGHTAGHAIEALSGFGITHGHAVAIGMSLIAAACDSMGLTESPCSPKIEQILHKYNINTHCPYPAEKLAQSALSDKKRTGGSITIVLLRSIGSAYLQKINVSDLSQYFAYGKDEKQ